MNRRKNGEVFLGQDANLKRQKSIAVPGSNGAYHFNRFTSPTSSVCLFL